MILFLVIDLATRWRGVVVVKLRLDSLMLLSFVNIAEIVCLSREFCRSAQHCYNCWEFLSFWLKIEFEEFWKAFVLILCIEKFLKTHFYRGLRSEKHFQSCFLTQLYMIRTKICQNSSNKKWDFFGVIFKPLWRSLIEKRESKKGQRP